MHSTYWPLVVVVVACLLVSASTFDLRKNLATKTPYWDQSTGFTPPPDTCYPVHLGLLARHGSREPTSGDVNNLSQLERRIASFKDEIENPQYEWLKTWKNPFSAAEAGWLTFQGEEEHYDLAKRFISYFPQLLDSPYTPARFDLRSTQVSRTGRSGNAFSYALFEGKGNIGKGRFDPFFITAANLSLDYQLRFFDTCPTYVTEVADNDTATIEGTLYMNAMFPLVANNISSILQLSNTTLSSKDAKTMWSACTLELSIDNDTSHFCSLFNEDSVRVMNYYADLQAYWAKGYGYDIDYTISCPLMQNFVDSMVGVITSPVDGYSERANLRFAHAETVMPFLALLGLFQDSQPLMHNSPQSFIDNHLWTTSKISTYAANVAFVLYNCSSEESTSDFRLKMLVNEKETPVPKCSDLYCPLKEFLSIYKNAIVNCDFEQMCGIKPCQEKRR